MVNSAISARTIRANPAIVPPLDYQNLLPANSCFLFFWLLTGRTIVVKLMHWSGGS